MERFRLRVRHEPKRGHIWELHLFPEYPHRQLREADARVLGSSATPEAMLWLRQIAEPFLLRAEAPEPLAAEQFGPAAAPRYRQAAGRAALRTLFTHEEPEDMSASRSVSRKRKHEPKPELNLFCSSAVNGTETV